jgi:integrase
MTTDNAESHVPPLPPADGLTEQGMQAELPGQSGRRKAKSVNITKTWLKARYRRPCPKTEVFADRDGLGVRISPKGKVTFQFRFYHGGCSYADRVDIGSYPRMSLPEAREEALRLGKALEKGESPKVMLRTERAARAAVNAQTLEILVRKWYDSYAVKAKKTAPQILRTFEMYVFPTLGALPAQSVGLHLWLPLLETLAEDIPAIAERVLTNAKQFLKWCRKRKYIETNPLADIMVAEDLQVRKARKVRFLSDDELKHVFRGIERSRMALKNRVFFMLCLIYGCRNGELRLALKKHCDFSSGVWTVPAENHKVGKLTLKPLCRPIIPVTEFLFRLAIELAGESEWLFPNANGDGPMTHSYCVHFPYNIMQYLRRYEKYEMTHWSMHVLRKTARTKLSMCTSWHVAEIALGHILPGEWKVYDGHDYLAEMREAYSSYWVHLARLLRESRLEVKATRRRHDPRHQLDLPDIGAPIVGRKIDQILLPPPTHFLQP